ncbi:MAG: putative toxin-antitoxin system toxin component, PIN family [Methanobacteriota archaeon]
MRPRAVLDTNVLVSALLWKGIPHKILLKALNREFDIIISYPLLNELRKTLQLKKFNLAKEEINGLVRIIYYLAEIVEINKKFDAALRDEEDRIVTDCALNGKANFIVTGDEDLLSLGSVRGVKIISPKEFVEKVL